MLSQFEPLGFIPTVDADRAQRFYVDTLGLKFISRDDFAIVVHSNCIDIRILRLDSFSPASYTIFGWKVPQIEATVRDLAAKGISFERYPFLQQDESAIWSAPGGAARVAWFKDPDGNILSVSQHA